MGVMSRHRFLRGDFLRMNAALRPPWAISEISFFDTCESCGKCRQACPEGILAEGAGGLPEVSFERGECTFCEECAKACSSGALILHDPGDASARRAPWTAEAEISNACLSAKGITCRVCGEVCDSGAITFKLAVGGSALAAVDTYSCTGCGACYAPCPTNAIRII